jgi:transposase InsO family protein
VFFLEEKGETFGFVQDLVLRLRNERHGDATREISSDNGSEFKNSHFETFWHDLGLEHQFSSPHTPPQNGVVKKEKQNLV